MSASVESSPAKLAKKAKTRSSEDEGKIVVTLPTEGSPLFVNEVTEGLLLLAERRRLNEIGPVKTVEWCGDPTFYQDFYYLKCSKNSE